MTRKHLLSLGIYALTGTVCLLLLPLLLPVLLGLLAAWALDPMIHHLERQWRISRRFASAVCVTGALLLTALLLWALGRMLLGVLWQGSRALPGILESAAGYVLALSQQLEVVGSRLPGRVGAAVSQWAAGLVSSSGTLAASLSGRVFVLVQAVLGALPGVGLFLITAVLSLIFAAPELPHLKGLVQRHLPEPHLRRLTQGCGSFRRAVGSYVEAQLLLLGVTFSLLLLGFLLLRVPSPLGMALATALLDALPIFGTGTVLLPWGLGALLTGNRPLGWGLLLLYGTAALTRSVLEPRLLGARAGVSPLLTLAALYGGWRIGGVGGMLLLPMGVITACTLWQGLRTPTPQPQSAWATEKSPKSD